jgi:CubicO group peptidase (beta-lactamase class C family)
MISRLAVLLVICIGVFSAPAFADDLDAILSKAVAGKATPGAGLLIIQDYEIVDEAVFGLRSLSDTTPVSRSDVWNIGSDGKAMTAVMIARLVDRGVLSWESTIGGVLPDLAGDVRPEYRAITLQQLLTHTSGLPENIRDEKALNSLFYDESSANLSERRRTYIARALQDAPAGRAGRFSYSNTGFLIAAFMAETASKGTYEALMRDEVFAPLRMTSAGFGRPPTGQPAGHKDGRIAVPRDVNPDFFAPAGNIYLSLDDWARFCIDQLRGANGEGALLKPETYLVMQSPPLGAPVSMGWFVRDKFAGLTGPVLYHEGSDGAWFAVVALFPASGSGVLAVTNGGKDMGGRELATTAARNAAKLFASKK